MTASFQKIYKLFPILFHYNNPYFPGYICEEVPYGISLFTPNIDQICFLKTFNNYKNFDFFIKKNDMPITGIYSMGSTSSIGQNNNSDLDIWIFYKSNIDQKKIKLLKKKCFFIEKWINNFGTKITLFLINDKFFKKNNNTILLDEFYRTSVRIAGKRLLWMIVEINTKENYNNYISILYELKIIRKNEWLDFGRLKKILHSNYVLDNIFQLRKNIDFPDKTILKSILLESYLFFNDIKHLSSIEFKKRLHSEELVFHSYDSYCLMLEKITSYLIKIEDFNRLDLVRRCFYFKISNKFSYRINNIKWRHYIFSKLIYLWNWNNKKIEMLNFKYFSQMEEIKEKCYQIINNLTKNVFQYIKKNKKF